MSYEEINMGEISIIPHLFHTHLIWHSHQLVHSCVTLLFSNEIFQSERWSTIFQEFVCAKPLLAADQVHKVYETNSPFAASTLSTWQQSSQQKITNKREEDEFEKKPYSTHSTQPVNQIQPTLKKSSASSVPWLTLPNQLYPINFITQTRTYHKYWRRRAE